MTESIYKQALQQGLRFPFKGQITTEDLWVLPLTSLDSIYKALNAKVKQSKEDSLLTATSKGDATLELQIAIIKDVVNTKLEAKKIAEEQAQLRSEKAKIMAVMADKKEEAFQNMDEAELAQKLAEVNGKLSK